ncbi:fibrinogen-like YCDxxxxGGGW domain-containing protein [Stigmatella sp. ncwal1]|uniref:Fibrinogen-like YCDxxxxGGGW domain-containing protein n=1 Tax=Stigmatella ashevillensis TaxID=2995309 RepID=A0ABT5DC80_9BACT|nr:fibrinogen-like YCDxxxxGGGW domain-containing protein [Stigmatella ashevillena]MDC0711284.1 fibrinogen-like YCDxxxxGGGW domain-containing protein [Stigmatella ashevillena]
MRWHWGTLVVGAILSLGSSPAWGSDALSLAKKELPTEIPPIHEYKNLDSVQNQNSEFSSSSGCPASGIVGFSVVGSGHVSSGEPTLLGYSGTYQNVGGGWIQGGGTFIAPCPGLYSFSVSFVKDAYYSAGTTDDVFVHIKQNGIDKGYAWSGEGAGYRDTGAYSVVLLLQDGDYIQTFVSSDGSSTRHLARYNFTGHLVKSSSLKANCREILEGGLSKGSGLYQVDFDDAAPLSPSWVYCDMTTDGGGWTLVMNQNPAERLPYNFSTVNPQNFGSLTETYRLGSSAIRALRPTTAWVLTDDSNRVYFQPTCMVEWETSLLNKPIGPCNQGFTSLGFSTPVSSVVTANGSMGIGQNNSGQYCSIRAFLYNQEPDTTRWPPGAALSCAGTTSQTIRLWFK